MTRQRLRGTDIMYGMHAHKYTETMDVLTLGPVQASPRYASSDTVAHLHMRCCSRMR